MIDEEIEKIEGSVEDIVFRSEDTGFTVLELNTDEELIAVVGEFSGVDVGEELILSGKFTTHATYGYQFKAEMYERRLPRVAGAIKKYLASGVIRGIGKQTAERIVERFGDETLDIIEKSPIRLAEVKGITIKKAEKFAEEFKEIFGVRTVMMFLSSHGISAAQSIRIWKRWGPMAVDIIKENPYLLCSGELEISFITADNIGVKMEIPSDSDNRIKAALGYVLQKNLFSGHTCLPEDKLVQTAQKILELDFEDIKRVLRDEVEENKLYAVSRNKEYIYLPSMMISENYIASRLSLMISSPPELEDELSAVIDLFEQENNIKYAKLQRQAIECAMSNQVMVLTGGPGTGKTTTLNVIIELFEQQGKNVLLSAPTGRAAKRISELTGKEAKTIHRLLEMDFSDSDRLEFVHNENKLLSCDVIIVDEISMIDTLLFDALLRAMPLHAKLILVGDCDQLPSVGAGNVLKDIIDSEQVPMIQLNEIFRQAMGSMIVTGAHDIIDGKMPNLERKDSDFFFIGRGEKMSAQETLIDLCVHRLPKSYNFDPYSDIQVLCPSRKGELGVTELNKRLQQQINPPDKSKAELKHKNYTFREGDKVMQTRNNYNIAWIKNDDSGLGIFNGDIGIIRDIDKMAGIARIEFDGRMVSYESFDMATDLELAYAITVHKSQGSEFEAVIMPVLGGFDSLCFRNLLYTAVTRAKKILVIVGSKNRLKYMIDNNHKMLRYTGLKYFLTNFD